MIVAALLLAASPANAQPCDLAIGWRHDGQIVRTPDCEDLKVSRMRGQSELMYTQSQRYDLRFLVNNTVTEGDIADWLATFCTQLNNGRADFERRSAPNRRDSIFFRCEATQ